MSLETSPKSSPLSSRRSSRSRTPLSLDLSSLPPLVQPTPPSNTLLITNLQDVDIFRADNLQTLRELINGAAQIHSWAPLKSFRRIVVSFFNEDAAIRVRQLLDGESIMGDRMRVYFGQPTAIEVKEQHLPLPDAGKLFFISPPPSPPQGWEVKLEDAPNKMVHAEDLAEALAKLHHHQPATGPELPASPMGSECENDPVRRRQRSSSSTMIFDPEAHGHSPNLPAIAVEDFTDEPGTISPIEKPILAHTARPPVELMMDA